MKKKKKNSTGTGMKVINAILWICFLSLLGIICYLSFQNQEAAKAFDKEYCLRVAQIYYGRENFSDAELVDITYKVRQLGRIVIFFALGVLGTATIHSTFRKLNWFIRTIISLAILLVIAIFTERYKVYLPTRHFSAEEMTLSIQGAMLGFALVSVLSLIIGIIVKLIKKIAP